jgi:hypothetical protein
MLKIPITQDLSEMKASVFLELKTVKNMKMATVFNAKETIR